ncbi:MAG: ABC transporter ATP-binding protein, partial [Saprospiraceae bacterium]|nr:ABC transporter ATP-binding protein [Saprospiraceae bacterium]
MTAFKMVQQQADKILEVKDLSLAFGEATVLHQLSFSLHQQEILGIVGESGSGKSLTSLSIMGLLASNAIVESGEITYYKNTGEAVPIHSLSPPQLNALRRSELSMIFQEPMTALNPVYTCGFQLREVLKLAGDHSAESAVEWLKKVELKDPERILKSYPHQISGGQKQRVMIAMAMAAQPKLLIADEPTTALDAHVRRSILDLNKRLSKAHGLAVLFISHDMDAVRYIADRILVMQKGLLVEQAETNQLLNNPQKAYTKGLIACKPPLRQSLHRLPTLDHLDPTPSPPIKASTTDAEP